jgi:dTDP-4-dehydrorhamnose reductase
MRVLATGVAGQLGYDVMRELYARGHEGIGTDLAAPVHLSPVCEGGIAFLSLDITDGEAVRGTVMDQRPDAVIHCAAWTAVDAAEEAENYDTVYAVNVTGTENLALACRDVGCKMLYISTDYVFDGQGDTPWTPDNRDYAPLNVYGRTKRMGEQAVEATLAEHFIVRIAWTFGANGKNFVRTMLNLSEKYDTLRVVSDQIGTPTYTKDLARLLVDMVETERYGCYHATNEGGYISWYDFAVEIFRQAGRSVTVLPVTTAEYGLSRAARPYNSRLDKSKLIASGFAPLPHWRDALARYLEEIEV